MGQYPVVFSTPWAPLGLTLGSDCSLMAGILLPKCLQGSPAHHPWWQQLLTTVTFLFMDMAGNISFLIQSITKIYDLGFDFGVGTIWKGLKGIIVLWPVGSSQTRDWTSVPCVGRQILPLSEPVGKPLAGRFLTTGPLKKSLSWVFQLNNHCLQITWSLLVPEPSSGIKLL